MDAPINPNLVIFPPSRTNTIGYVVTSLILVTLLAAVTPLIALVTGIPLLVLVTLSGITYLVFIAITDQTAEGIISMFFILITFNADVPIINAPGMARLDIYLLDLSMLLAGLYILYWKRNIFKRLPKLGKLSIFGLAGFFIWSIIAALVGNGPSNLAAILFSFEQLRYLIVLVTAAAIVRSTNLRSGIYPMIIGIGGHTLFAMAQAINGSYFGLSYLGEGSNRILGDVMLGPFTLQAGQYMGGFTGTTRVLIGLLLLTGPLFIAVLLLSRYHFITSVVTIVAIVALIELGDTDAGLGAFIVSMALFALLVSTIMKRSLYNTPIYASSVAIFGILLSILSNIWIRITDVLAIGSTPSESTPSESTPSESTPSESTPSESTPSESTLPIVDTSTLSVRLEQYTAAIDIGIQYPLFGIGGSNFNLIAESYGLSKSFAVHNTYLAYLVATGIPGLLFYFIAAGTVVLVAIREAWNRTGDTQIIFIGIFCGLIGYHAFSFWTTVYTNTTASSTLWALSGIVIGASLRKSGEQR